MRLFTFLILLVYAFQASALSMKLYFCGDKFSGIGFFEEEKESCCKSSKNKCCPKQEKKNCCSETQIESQDIDEQYFQSLHFSFNASFGFLKTVTYFLRYPQVFSFFFESSIKESKFCWQSDKPLSDSLPIYLSISNFRI